MADEKDPAPFAILMFKTLAVKRFTHKDEWHAAISTLKAADKCHEFAPWRYNKDVGMYVIAEVAH